MVGKSHPPQLNDKSHGFLSVFLRIVFPAYKYANNALEVNIYIFRSSKIKKKTTQLLNYTRRVSDTQYPFSVEGILQISDFI